MFHVLSECGHGDLAYRMITRRDYPSFGMLIEQGLTSMPENFLPPEEWDSPASLNHHFMGDVPNWFITKVAGIRVNPDLASPDHIDICPDFISGLDFAEGFHTAPGGTVSVRWERADDSILLDVSCENGMYGKIILPDGYCFIDESNKKGLLHHSAVTVLRPGKYTVKKQYTY